MSAQTTFAKRVAIMLLLLMGLGYAAACTYYKLSRETC